MAGSNIFETERLTGSEKEKQATTDLMKKVPIPVLVVSRTKENPPPANITFSAERDINAIAVFESSSDCLPHIALFFRFPVGVNS